jgi:hypothetical protein
MKISIIVGALAVLALGGCQKAGETPASGLGSPHGKGRYFGVGLYPAGRMWPQLVATETDKDPAASKLADDEEIIVVLDSATGELRQCGNLSGACISMNPWVTPLAASRMAPVLLGKHAEQLNEEAEAAARAANAKPAK